MTQHVQQQIQSKKTSLVEMRRLKTKFSKIGTKNCTSTFLVWYGTINKVRPHRDRPPTLFLTPSHGIARNWTIWDNFIQLKLV